MMVSRPAKISAAMGSNVPTLDEEKKSISTPKLVYGSDDSLFGCVESNQRATGRPFGDLLDAGTGTHSLRWIASLLHSQTNPSDDLHVSKFTAITADESMKRNVLAEAEQLGIVDRGEVVIGNWASEEKEEGQGLCVGETYDTILADYLIGAIDGFSPYFQDRIFPRLASHLRPGGCLYVVGLNPIPDSIGGDADVFCRVTKLRDACILLAGHRCYREFPVDWIQRHLELAGLEVKDTSRFPIKYSHGTIVRQLNVARSKLPLFPSKGLAEEMRKQIDELEKESLAATERSPTGRLTIGFDYVVTAEMPLVVGEEKEQ